MCTYDIKCSKVNKITKTEIEVINYLNENDKTRLRDLLYTLGKGYGLSLIDSLKLMNETEPQVIANKLDIEYCPSLNSNQTIVIHDSNEGLKRWLENKTDKEILLLSKEIRNSISSDDFFTYNVVTIVIDYARIYTYCKVTNDLKYYEEYLHELCEHLNEIVDSSVWRLFNAYPELNTLDKCKDMYPDIMSVKYKNIHGQAIIKAEGHIQICKGKSLEESLR